MPLNITLSTTEEHLFTLQNITQHKLLLRRYRLYTIKGKAVLFNPQNWLKEATAPCTNRL